MRTLAAGVALVVGFLVCVAVGFVAACIGLMLLVRVWHDPPTEVVTLVFLVALLVGTAASFRPLCRWITRWAGRPDTHSSSPVPYGGDRTATVGATLAAVAASDQRGFAALRAVRTLHQREELWNGPLSDEEEEAYAHAQRQIMQETAARRRQIIDNGGV